MLFLNIYLLDSKKYLQWECLELEFYSICQKVPNRCSLDSPFKTYFLSYISFPVVSITKCWSILFEKLRTYPFSISKNFSNFILSILFISDKYFPPLLFHQKIDEKL